MLMILLLLVLLPHLHHGFNTRHACIPNSQFVLNGKMCFCDHQGWWDESFCLAASRRTCTSGQIIWQGCSKCVCQDSGHLTCTDAGCYDAATQRSDLIVSTTLTGENQDSKITWCTPFKSYYYNCSICVCPASGNTSEAHCATDNSCQQLPPSTSDFLTSINKNICIPRVMYLFPCLHCLCSDGGYFILDKCVETCHRLSAPESTRRCISKTFYRKNCNVCWCPENSIPDDKLCTRHVCNRKSKFTTLKTLRMSKSKCKPHTFLEPKCFYCTCNTNGNINDHACLKLDCLKTIDFKYDLLKNTCSPGEMIPICSECFCLGSGITNTTYCSNVCTYQNKLIVLEDVLRDNLAKGELVAKDTIIRSSDSDSCDPNTMYLDQGRYCLCPDNGSTNFKICTSYTEDTYVSKLKYIISNNTLDKNLNMTCTPNTFVEIDCNTCYCAKNATIDLRWCTYDDCNAKRIIQSSQKNIRVSTIHSTLNDTCVPGSITKVDCNFCICPESGMLRERACTKNKCSEVQDIQHNTFICEPLNYYLVDCNVCLCPRDGVKNVEKCTKKICEKTFLRSDNCVPGEFFSNDCNVCVCPPNGDKADRVCTKHRCSDSESTWRKIFRLSQSLLDNKLLHYENNKRNLDVCFSGEEFEIGCKICVCTDLGLKSYATCADGVCDDIKPVNNSLDNAESIDALNDDRSEIALMRSRRNDQECLQYNLTDSSERKDCTPGSIYIIRCRQCICPYLGNINYFCRPLPKGEYCEQAHPGFNYLPMGRRSDNSTASNGTDVVLSVVSTNETMNHNHTKYSCEKPGKILDECFVCECDEDLSVIEEHCFKSNDDKCIASRPTFLDTENKIVLGYIFLFISLYSNHCM